MTKNHGVNSIWRSAAILLTGLVFFQSFLFISFLESENVIPPKIDDEPRVIGGGINHPNVPPNHSEKVAEKITIATSRGDNNNVVVSSSTTTIHDHHPEGVAITLMLKAPKWFHRRYTAMLHNVLSNTPETWVIQVFSNEAWLEKDVLPLHPGLQRLRSHPRIIWTPMPKEMTKKKPKEIMKSNWLWESVIAENILTFSGNGALCANSKNTVTDFIVEADYVGVPWGKYNGMGGNGSSHSIRKRSDMIRILQEHPPSSSEMNDQDYNYFTKYLFQGEKGKLANANITRLFGGTNEADGGAPFVVAGTQAQLDFDSREKLLHVCPELNIIFPSLHEPSCFGAHPDSEKCKNSICALQDKIPGSGC
jgi:hypothetical protein